MILGYPSFATVGRKVAAVSASVRRSIMGRDETPESCLVYDDPQRPEWPTQR
jgi:hypothetical protein